ncbi:DUF4262 domain-containing protein [Paludisphaera soli]|uniref:DUF4262 domain-containing protein n=1 Tax=Paludisphaera soli TaxID=2712865 RepID=UPI0013E9E843|nr:DUF4262 domain-containing protein [Paludisphaera soli]
MSEVERTTRESIARHGWHVIKVPDDAEGPGFAYNIGFHMTFDHPEVIVFGLDLDIMHRMINNLGFELRAGARFGPGDRCSEVLETCEVAFQAVARRHYDEYFGFGIRIQGEAFEAIQMCWPDARGRFPWESGFSSAGGIELPRLDVD